MSEKIKKILTKKIIILCLVVIAFVIGAYSIKRHEENNKPREQDADYIIDYF